MLSFFFFFGDKNDKISKGDMSNSRVEDIARHLTAPDANRADAAGSTRPLRVCVTGAAGQIGYALVFSIARGDFFGPQQPVVLHLLEVEAALSVLRGVVMELEDCALPLLHGVVPTASYAEGFAGVDYAILVSAFSGRVRLTMSRRWGRCRARRAWSERTCSRPT